MSRLQTVAFAAFLAVVLMFFALAFVSIAGCAAFTGRYAHSGQPIVTVEHQHSGACWNVQEGAKYPRSCVLWVRNGSTHTITFNVDCRGSGVAWERYELPAGQDQGFAEWDGECRVSKWYGWLEDVR